MVTATKSQQDQTELALKLNELATEGGRLISFTEPISTPNPLTFFNNGKRLTGTAYYWSRPEEDLTLVGVGAAIILRGTGQQRFKQIADAWSELAKNFKSSIQFKGAGPILMGGFAFDPEKKAVNPQWQNFGDGSMTLPQFQLLNRGSQSYLTCNIVLPSNFCEFTQFERLNFFEQNAENISLLRSTISKASASGFSTQITNHLNSINDVLPSEEWQTIVGSATRSIKNGSFQKAVLARQVTAYFENPIEIEATIQRLENNFPTATIFAISQNEQCFIGASPERLVKLNKGNISTAALAGSAPRSLQPDQDEKLGQELLNSEKNKAEHAIVVQMITEQLQEICDYLFIPNEPRLLKLANVQHLYTPIEGRLRSNTSLLELVARLHPTPAMGGYPRQTALEFIRQNEQLDRGWYAAPIGWMDVEGEGDFVVAIRSALITENQADLFAGCGIVADSNPASEYQETKFKLEAIAKNL